MKKLILLVFTTISCSLFGQVNSEVVNKSKTYEIIWNTKLFESPSVIRELNDEELIMVEEYRLDDDINVIYINDVMSVKIYPKNVINIKK